VRRAARPPNLALLGERLESLRREWRTRRLDSDPLLFPHRYADPGDREVVAFLSASLAFGRVASIQASIARILAALGPRPTEFLERWDETAIAGLERFAHRWVTGKDIEEFLRMVKRARRVHGSLGALFAKGDGEKGNTGGVLEGEERKGRAARAKAEAGVPARRVAGPGFAASADYVQALSSFHRNLFRFSSHAAPSSSSYLGNLQPVSPRATAPSRGLRFLLPSPAAGSACKRSHLFLRWMIRSEGFDLGLWRGGRFTPARLLLPMDVHLHRISRRIGLTRRPTADLAASREATAWLRRISPADPVAYDWPLSRLGILGLPVTLPAARA
jgi:uncharacterized protein (TIGR02757 family)